MLPSTLLTPLLLLPLALLVVVVVPQLALGVSVVDRELAYADAPSVEHQVTLVQALQEARNIKLYAVPSGCKPCTRDEMNYCRNNSVVEDHCCCDHNELLGEDVLKFVEHTCFLSTEACQVRAGNCGEYMRLRECCCHTYMVSDWKYRAGGAGSTRASYFLSCFASLCTVILTRLFL